MDFVTFADWLKTYPSDQPLLRTVGRCFDCQDTFLVRDTTVVATKQGGPWFCQECGQQHLRSQKGAR